MDKLFCEGALSTDTSFRYCGTDGKPGGKRRKQTSTCGIWRNFSTRLKSNKSKRKVVEVKKTDKQGGMNMNSQMELNQERLRLRDKFGKALPSLMKAEQVVLDEV
jgi:hypothetical protein